jgi:hypothetical protein
VHAENYAALRTLEYRYRGRGLDHNAVHSCQAAIGAR